MLARWSHAVKRWCKVCLSMVKVEDEWDDQIGFEEQARYVHVVRYECGHEYVTPIRWRPGP